MSAWRRLRATVAGWSPRRQTAAAAAAAVVVLVVGLAAGLLYGLARPPSDGAAAPASPRSPTVAPTPPATLLRAAAAALRAAPSARVAGTLGQTPSVRVDLAVDSAGDATGSVVTGGITVDVVRVAGRTYLRSSDLVRRIAGPVVASFVGDSWLLLDPKRFASTGIPRALDDATSLDGLASVVTSGTSTARRGPTRMVGGARAIEVLSVAGEVDVAAAPPRYPLRIAAGGLTDLSLRDFGAPVDAQAPTSGVIDLSRLPGLG